MSGFKPHPRDDELDEEHDMEEEEEEEQVGGEDDVKTVLDFPYSTRTKCETYTAKVGYVRVPDVVIVWNAAGELYPPKVTITCKEIPKHREQAHIDELIERYISSFHRMAAFQMTMNSESEDMWKKMDELDQWLNTLDEQSQPVFELGYMEADMLDLKHTTDRIYAELQIALDALGPLVRLSQSQSSTGSSSTSSAKSRRRRRSMSTSSSSSRSNSGSSTSSTSSSRKRRTSRKREEKEQSEEEERNKLFYEMLANRYAGLVVGVPQFQAQWSLALNKVKFHIGRLLDNSYTTSEMEQIQTLSGYKLPSDWRLSVVKVKRAAKRAFQWLWNKIKSVAQTVKEYVWGRNTAGLLLTFLILWSLSAAAGSAGLIAGIVSSLSSLVALKGMADRMGWLKNVIRWLCGYLFGDDFMVAVILWFIRSYAIKLYVNIIGLSVFGGGASGTTTTTTTGAPPATAVAVDATTETVTTPPSEMSSFSKFISLIAATGMSLFTTNPLLRAGAVGAAWFMPQIKSIYDQLQARYPSWEESTKQNRATGFVIFQVGMIFLVHTIRSFASQKFLRTACNITRATIATGQIGAALLDLAGAVGTKVSGAVADLMDASSEWVTDATNSITATLLPTFSDPFSLVNRIMSKSGVSKLLGIIGGIWSNLSNILRTILVGKVEEWATFWLKKFDTIGIYVLGTDEYIATYIPAIDELQKVTAFVGSEREKLGPLAAQLITASNAATECELSSFFPWSCTDLSDKYNELFRQYSVSEQLLLENEREIPLLQSLIVTQTTTEKARLAEYSKITNTVQEPGWGSLLMNWKLWAGITCVLGLVGVVIYRTSEVRENDKRITPIGHIPTFPTVLRFEVGWDKDQPKEGYPYPSGRTLLVARHGVWHLNKEDPHSGGWIMAETGSGGKRKRLMNDEEWEEYQARLEERYDALIDRYEEERVLDIMDWKTTKAILMEELDALDTSEDGWNAENIKSKRDVFLRDMRESPPPVSRLSSLSSIRRKKSTKTATSRSQSLPSSRTSTTTTTSTSASTISGRRKSTIGSGDKQTTRSKSAPSLLMSRKISVSRKGDVTLEEAKSRIHRMIEKTRRRKTSPKKFSTKVSSRSSSVSSSIGSLPASKRRTSSVGRRSKRNKSAKSSSSRASRSRSGSSSRSSKQYSHLTRSDEKYVE